MNQEKWILTTGRRLHRSVGSIRADRADSARWLSAAVAVAALCSACEGRIAIPTSSDKLYDPSQGPGSELEKCEPSAPAHVVVRRLNRNEYNNTVRDLLGDTTRPAEGFPSDIQSNGFDNESVLQTFNAGILSKMQAASERLALAAVQNGIISCDPAKIGERACAESVLFPLARRAYRRPLTTDQKGELLKLVDLAKSKGDTFKTGIELAIRRVLLAPEFLYRFEIPENPPTTGQTFELDAFELASRLSYFLWSSAPDESLLAAAEDGSLLRREVLERQVQRMLDDPKATALGEELSWQWLRGSRTAETALEPKDFPNFKPELQGNFLTESTLFLNALIKEDRDFGHWMETDFAFLNERLAKHYGVQNVTGPAFQRVKLEQHPHRGGLFGLGTFDMGISSRVETVELRGAWAAKNLLCRTLGAPPSNALDLNPVVPEGGSRRDQANIRMQMAVCGGCHKTIDSLGLALENYDVDGSWRLKDLTGHEIDASGTVPNLGAFKGPKELAHLLSESNELRSCIAITVAQFALGRRSTHSDTCAVRQALFDGVEHRPVTSRAFIVRLANSALFRLQGADQ